MEYIQNIITTLKNYLTPQENNDIIQNEFEKFSKILKEINENIYNLIEYENLYSTKTTDFINPYCGLFTKISSFYHIRHRKKGGLICSDRPLCREFTT
jgi:hypothetical protein